jgi:hypothetical protein
MVAVLEMVKRSALKIPSLPDHYERRVFIGGNYDDMPLLRKIVGYVNGTGFRPILAFDVKKVPKKKIHDFDMKLLSLCKYAIFEVSTGNGQMMEIQSAFESLGTVVFAVYKTRSARHSKPSEAVSTMLTTLGVPMLPYDDDDRLREIVTMILPGIEEDPGPTWVNIVRGSFSPYSRTRTHLFISWFASNIDYILQHL